MQLILILWEVLYLYVLTAALDLIIYTDAMNWKKIRLDNIIHLK